VISLPVIGSDSCRLADPGSSAFAFTKCKLSPCRTPVPFLK
jgi:hypothetical protein